MQSVQDVQDPQCPLSKPSNHLLWAPCFFCTLLVHPPYFPYLGRTSPVQLSLTCYENASLSPFPLPLRIIPLFWGSPYFTQYVRVAQIVQGIPPLPLVIFERRLLPPYPIEWPYDSCLAPVIPFIIFPSENSSTFSLFSIPPTESFGGDRNVPGRESRREITHSPTIVLPTLQPRGNSPNSSS